MSNPVGDDLNVLRCWACSGTTMVGDGRCRKCDGTGSLFWSGGFSFPYTPAGEKQARLQVEGK